MQGRKLEADLLRVEGASALLRIGGKETPVPLVSLSAEDQAFITQWQQEQLEAAMTYAGTKLVPGKAIQVEVPYKVETYHKLAQEQYGKPTSLVKVLLAVPKDFDPMSRKNKVLLVHATASGANGGRSILAAGMYLQAALDDGWMVLASDGEFGQPPNNKDSPGFRDALVVQSLEAMKATWPHHREWTYANAGFSGGCGYASWTSISMNEWGFKTTGMFLACGHFSPALWEKEYPKHKPKAGFHNLPVFMSYGDKDTTCKPTTADATIAATKGGNYNTLKVEHFDGGHQMNKDHFKAALTWFDEHMAADKKSFGSAK